MEIFDSMLQFDSYMGPVVELEDPFSPGSLVTAYNPVYGEATEIGSFSEYLIGRNLYFLKKYLDELISEGKLPVGKYSRKVPYPTHRCVDSVDVVKVYLTARNATTVAHDIIISCEIAVADKYCLDSVSQWYRVRGSTEIVSDSPSTALCESITIYDKADTLPGVPLSEFLIPFIYKNKADDFATGVLKRYWPEVLEKPMRVDGIELARRMGLTVELRKLSSDGSIKGRVYFMNGKLAETTDSGDVVTRSVRAGTIIIDTDAKGHISDEQLNNTIIHECIHYEIHKFFYYLQLLHGDSLSYINFSGNMNKGDFPGGGDSPLFWMEQQARQLTPRIQMVAKTTEVKIQQYLSKAYSMGRPELRAMEYTVKELADFFHVSRQSACLRVAELGHPQAEGICNYVNGEYVPSYKMPRITDNTSSIHVTYTISFSDAADEYANNPEFQSVLDSGFYLYVDGHFVLKKPKYLTQNRKGNLTLSYYAKNHMDECCLVFEVHRSSVFSFNYQLGVLNSEVIPEGTIKAEYNSSGNMTVEIWAARQSEREHTYQKVREMPKDSFGSALAYLMNDRGFTVESFSEVIKMSDSTVKRLRSKDDDYPLTTRLFSSISLVLGLEPEISDALADIGKVKFRNNKEDMTFRFMLHQMYKSGLSVCNQALISSGMKPFYSDLKF